MRVGAMVVGILFSIWTFFEALLVTGVSGMADDEEMGAAGAGSLLAAIVAGIASALVLALPLFSTVLFGLAGLISFAAAGAGYGNHWFYGSVFLVLGVMAFFGWIGKRKDRRELVAERQRQLERDDRLEMLLRQQRDQVRYPTAQHDRPDNAPKMTFPTFCPACKHRNEAGARFCANCGSTLSPATATTRR